MFSLRKVVRRNSYLGIENRNDLKTLYWPGETVTSQLSPSSPTEDSSGESRPDKPRLQRSMGQSKRTFRLKKSRKSHIDIPHLKLEYRDCSPVQATVQTPPSSAVESIVFSIPPSESSSFRSRANSSMRQTDHDRSNDATSTDQYQHQQHQQEQQPNYHHYHHHHHHHHHHHQHHQNLHHHLHPQSDVSWDEDTSSTSGYRESYSLQLVSLEGNNRSINAPPLASPDLNDMPSTSSTATNYMGYDGSSPDCSMNGSGGEKTALLNSSQRTESQNSLLMVFQTRDEDTLI